MTRTAFRRILIGLTLLAAGVAAWSFWRPYDWRPDPAARYRMAGAELVQDHSYYWLYVHLKRAGELDHDFQQPVRLQAGANVLEPADTTFAGSPETGMTEMWFRFWLERQDVEGPLELHLNGGSLRVKASHGIPSLGSSGRKFFHSTSW